MVRARIAADRDLTGQIRHVHADNCAVYGSPRVHAALCAQGRRTGVNRVARLMRHHGIQGRYKRRGPRTTDSPHALPLARTCSTDSLRHLLRTGRGWPILPPSRRPKDGSA
ncbi:MAG: IS3 family transposase [Janthinobacterium lividum]